MYMDEWIVSTKLTILLVALLALGVIFALLLIVGLAKIFTIPKYTLRIDHEGLHPLHGDFKNLHIEWKNIQGFQQAKLGFNDIVYVHVTNPQELAQHFTGWKRKVIDMSIQKNGTPLWFMPSTYKGMNTQKMMQLLQNAQQQARAQY
jgi:hypothetical protein